MIVPENTICGKCGLLVADGVPRAFRIARECICPERWPGVPVYHTFRRVTGSPVGASRRGSGGKGPPGAFRRVLGLLAGLAGAVPGAVSPAAGGPAPEMCRPYATAFTETMIKEVWLGAYEYCRVEGVGDAVPLLPPDLRAATAVLSGDLPGTVGPSGFAPGTDGWKAWCRRVWPGSFDGQTVIFEANGNGRRTRCPG